MREVHLSPPAATAHESRAPSPSEYRRGATSARSSCRIRRYDPVPVQVAIDRKHSKLGQNHLGKGYDHQDHPERYDDRRTRWKIEDYRHVQPQTADDDARGPARREPT